MLADNGGPTRTHVLLEGSSAIDATPACGLATDQRSSPRNDDACDSGSYEFQCELTLSRSGGLTSIFFSPTSSPFDLVAGALTELLGDGDFSQASCLGTFATSPAIDPWPEPPTGDGRYYLARGVIACVGAGYGDSSVSPDPRDALDSGPCP